LECTARAEFGADPIDPRDRSFVSANDSENGLPRYDAFIAYSHAKDKPIASALVQKLGKPGTGGGLCACFATTEPVGDAASVAFDRDRAWSVALSDPTRFA
jgi:hypothetical protein